MPPFHLFVFGILMWAPQDHRSGLYGLRCGWLFKTSFLSLNDWALLFLCAPFLVNSSICLHFCAAVGERSWMWAWVKTWLSLFLCPSVLARRNGRPQEVPRRSLQLWTISIWRWFFARELQTRYRTYFNSQLAEYGEVCCRHRRIVTKMNSFLEESTGPCCSAAKMIQGGVNGHQTFMMDNDVMPIQTLCARQRLQE